jgi:hypothetical protein
MRLKRTLIRLTLNSIPFTYDHRTLKKVLLAAPPSFEVLFQGTCCAHYSFRYTQHRNPHHAALTLPSHFAYNLNASLKGSQQDPVVLDSMQPSGLAVPDGARCTLPGHLRPPGQPCRPTHIPSHAIDFRIALLLTEISSFLLNMVFDFEKFR